MGRRQTYNANLTSFPTRIGLLEAPTTPDATHCGRSRPVGTDPGFSHILQCRESRPFVRGLACSLKTLMLQHDDGGEGLVRVNAVA